MMKQIPHFPSLRSTRRDEPVTMTVRIPIARVVKPFFIAAVTTYIVLIVCTYPLLLERSSQSGQEKYNVEDHMVIIEDLGEKVQERHVREVQSLDEQEKRVSDQHRGKEDIFDRVLRMRKRVERANLDTTKNYVHSQDNSNGFVKKDINAGAGDQINVESGKVINDVKDPHQETHQEMEGDGKKKPYYNKLITVPKSERYIDEPVDAHTYQYIHRPEVCHANGHALKIQLIFMVTTAPRHFERRQLIRDTYGNKRNWPTLRTGGFRTVFLLGAVDNATLQREIDAEFAEYADIVQEDFVDSYANLTLKTVMGLKWVTNYCRQAKFTMKIDDDSMIHQHRLLRMLNNATAVNFTAAEALINAPVLRNTSSKYYIAEKYFPDPTYPPYLNGPGYLISTDLAEGLYRVATSIPLFPWEDVFLGLCLKELGVVPEERHDFMLIIAEFSQIADKAEAVKLFRYFTVVSNLEPEYMMLMWESWRFRIRKT